MPRSHEILEHVHQITLQREQDLLSCSLLKSVEQILQTTSCLHVTLKKDGQLLACAEITGGRFIVSESMTMLAQEIPDLLLEMSAEVIESRRDIFIDGIPAGIDLVFRGDGTFQFLVYMRTTPFRANELRVLSGMLSIYTNFQTLLNESQMDQLTGLANRKTFEGVISHIFSPRDYTPPRDDVPDEKRAESEESKWWLAMLDVDDFKRVNDEFGHLYGDEILINLANLIKESFRQEDYKFRFGGEEFVVLLRARDKSDCQLTLERLLQRVRDYKFPAKLHMTLSIGVVELKRDVFHVTALDYADKALYHSKREGKDRITFYESLVNSESTETGPTQEGTLDFF